MSSSLIAFELLLHSSRKKVIYRAVGLVQWSRQVPRWPQFSAWIKDRDLNIYLECMGVVDFVWCEYSTTLDLHPALILTAPVLLKLNQIKIKIKPFRMAYSRNSYINRTIVPTNWGFASAGVPTWSSYLLLDNRMSLFLCSKQCFIGQKLRHLLASSSFWMHPNVEF